MVVFINALVGFVIGTIGSLIANCIDRYLQRRAEKKSSNLPR